MEQKIRAVQIGCGPIGCAVAELALQRPNIELVGSIDIDKDKVGKDLGQVIGLDKRVGIAVSDDLDGILSGAGADVVFHHTSSSLKAVAPQLKHLAELGVNVVSTTEELAYPYRYHPELAAEIDREARANQVTILSTGVNPGYVMDTWPLSITAVSQEVRKVKVVRIQDASPRRLPFQKKIGAGRTTEEFQKLVDAGTLRHVGLPESIAMVAAGLGWELDDITETIEPIIAKERVQSQYITVEPGQAAGVRQVGRGLRGGEEIITMEFEAYLGAPESYEAVYLTGTPNKEVIVKGGTHGDIATAAIVVNAA
ncbi:MAG: dihydrodipicolinate reductase, partial [Dehalococcoidia bacterium]